MARVGNRGGAKARPRAQWPVDVLGERHAAGGFTLIELLIVIAIILALMGLVSVGVTVARKKAKDANAQADISSIKTALAQYDADLNRYPGYRRKADEGDLENFNAYPALFKALFYDKSQGGGPNGPYVDFDAKRILVEDLDEESGYIVAKPSEVRDEKLDKYFSDPWGSPMTYRENRSKRKKRDWMIKRSGYDLWSWGPNKKNQSWEGLLDPEEYEEKNDDVGNW